jgi:ABC-type transport system involved in multi-copper enzyme maturation permease subunit
MFRQLLWKEWRENLWKLIFCGAISLAFTALLFRIRLFPDSANSMAISFVQMLAVPVVYALDIFSGEMSNRTIHLLFKFPVARWKIFFSKYLVCILGMSIIFLATGLLMEVMGHRREAEIGFLFKSNSLFGISSLIIFTWFCVFAAQSHSEAGSLVAMFGVLIGWGIVLFWSTTCEVSWAFHFVPYSFIVWTDNVRAEWFQLHKLIFSQTSAFIIAVSVACYRFVKVRRYL